MDRTFELKPHLRVVPDGEVSLFLVGERERYLLSGRVYALVVPLLDGRRTVAELIRELEGRASAPEVFFAVERLAGLGHIRPAREVMPRHQAAYWDSLSPGADRAVSALARAPVAVRALGGALSGPVESALRGAGVLVRPEASILILVVEDYLAPEVAEALRRAGDQGQRVIPCKLAGVWPWVGPAFGRDEGPCPSCLMHRLRANRPVETYLEHKRGISARPPVGWTPTSLDAAASFAALEVARWIASEGGPLDDHLLALDLIRPEVTRHRLIRRPQCPACGDPELIRRQAEEPIRLRPRPCQFTRAGGFRSLAPEETYERLAHHVSPITGVVSSLGPLPGRSHPLRPVFGAGYFVSLPSDPPRFDDFHRSSAGKGCDGAGARTSALCEALERISALWQGGEARRWATFDELGERAIHPDALQSFSRAQLDRRDEDNAKVDDPRRRTPEPFDPGEPISWTPVWSLTAERRRWVPAAYCYQGADDPAGERLCPYNPNGHAAGNNLEEAALQAALELIERDAVAIWWYNRARRPGIDLESFGEPYFVTLRDHYRSLGWRLWALDLTTDLEIPAVVALARSGEGRFSVGFGCHLEPRLAVSRALTEVNQLFDPEGERPAPWADEALPDRAFLSPASDRTALTAAQIPNPARGIDDLAEAVRLVVHRLDQAGLETLALDQTRPDLGLSAIKVIVPGLRHFWRRLGPGRLYDVPVALGWLPRPLAEVELNPVPLLL